MWASAVLVDGRVPGAAALALLVAEGFDGTAGSTGLYVETFFATGAACLASSVFLTAGLEAGFALAIGFFTVTGSFDELGVRFLRGWTPMGTTGARRLRGPRHACGLADGELRGYTPEIRPATSAALCRKSHIVAVRTALSSELARDCIEGILTARLFTPLRRMKAHKRCRRGHRGTRCLPPSCLQQIAVRPGIAPAPAPGFRAADRCR